MLAGCVGANRKGTDVLPLPRLVGRAGRLRVRVSNLAPEKERRGDVVGFVAGSGEAARPHVLVIKVRNTATFEAVMRRALPRGALGVAPGSRVRFGESPDVVLKPVGTKFLRRVVVPVPRGAHSATLTAPTDLWFVPRIWIGAGRAVDAEVTWRSPAGAMDPDSRAVRLLVKADREGLRLEPMRKVDLVFKAGDAPAPATRPGYVLEMRGYDEFLPAPILGGDDLP